MMYLYTWSNLDSLIGGVSADDPHQLEASVEGCGQRSVVWRTSRTSFVLYVRYVCMLDMKVVYFLPLATP